MNIYKEIAFVAELFSQSNDWHLRSLARELRDKLKQHSLSREEALDLLRWAEKEAALAAAWAAIRQPRR